MNKTQAAFISSLPIDQIQIKDGFNPRRDLGDLSDLKASIKTQGLINPISVVADGAGGYFLVAGARRLAASIQNGATDILVVIHNEFSIESPEAKGFALAENFEGGRHNLSDMDLAHAYKALYDQIHDEHESEKARHTAVGKLVGGLSYKHVSHTLKLLDAPASIQDKLNSGDLSKAAVATLVTIPEDIRERVAQRVSDTEGSLTEADVRRVAKTVQQEDKVTDLEAEGAAEDKLSTEKDITVWRSHGEVRTFIKQFCIDAQAWKDESDKEQEASCLGSAAALMWVAGMIEDPQHGTGEFNRSFKKILAEG